MTSVSLKPISLGTVDLTDADIARAVECLQKRQLSPGPVTQEFERVVAARHGQPYATYCNSGQSALHLILEALKTRLKIKRVLVPALTYISSLHAVWNAGLQVQLVDVDPKTYVWNWAEMPTLRDGDVYMPVHLFGYPVSKPAGAGGMTIVEDACESLGAEGIGYGDAMAFSFYVAHTITTGVGGMATTRHPWLDDTIKRLCNHGRARAADLYAGLRVDHVDADVRFRFTDIGFSFKLGDVNAALGIGQMERLPSILSRRRQVAGWLTERLLPYPLQLPYDDGKHTFMMYPLVCHEAKDRDPLMDCLAEAGIETRHLMPVTNQPVVQKVLGDITGQYPVADLLNAHGFYLGCHQHLTEEDCDRVEAAVRSYFGHPGGSA